jgi:hypothetical protein
MWQPLLASPQAWIRFQTGSTFHIMLGLVSEMKIFILESGERIHGSFNPEVRHETYH